MRNIVFGKMFLFALFIPVNLISGQKNTFVDLDGRHFSVVLTKSTSTFQNAQCPFDMKMMTHNMTQIIREINFDWSDRFWINSSVEYTQWVYYRGIYSIELDQIKQSTKLPENGNQLATCVSFCNSSLTIGLQVDNCLCLLNDATFSTPLHNRVNVSACKNNHIALCASTNTQNIVTIYQKESVSGTFYEIGECLTVRTNNTNDISYMYISKRCDSKSGVWIKIGNGFLPIENVSWFEAKKFIDSVGGQLPIIKDFTLIDLRFKLLRNQEFWLSYFREPIYLDLAPDQFSLCVSGRAVNGKIDLRPENCSAFMHAVCLKELSSYTFSVSSFSTTSMSDNTTIPGAESTFGLTEGYVVYIMMGTLIVVVVIVIVYRRKLKKHEDIQLSTKHYQDSQTRQRLSRILSISFRDNISLLNHDYIEILPDASLAIASTLEDVDGYLVPHPPAVLHKFGNFRNDKTRQAEASNYRNGLPMHPLEPFDLYQQLENNRQSNTHIYTPITNEGLYGNI